MRVRNLMGCFAALNMFVISPQVLAQLAQANYQAKCSICHDGGAGQAPRLQDRAAWAERAAKGRQALYATAIQGKPNTAMAAKGGFTELSDQEVRDIVDHMLKVSGNSSTPFKQESVSTPQNAKADGASRKRSVPISPRVVMSDHEISQAVAERLLKSLGTPQTTLDEYEGVITVRGVGIKVQTQQGVTTLFGSVKEGDQVAKAESLAAVTTGVKRVVNKLIAASVFEWD
jgi:cytochrome c5